MTDFYKEFSTSTEAEWLDKVKIDLKGKSIDEALHKFHPIEEINYSSYGFANDKNQSHAIPGQANYARGGKIQNNDWINNIYVPKDSPKNMNAFALKQLMNGATGLTFDLYDFDANQCDLIIKEIGFEHIASTFYYSTKEQYDWLNKLASTQSLNGSAINTGNQKFGLINNIRNFIVKGIDVQYAGGNIHQEVGYALNKGHALLYQLINDGMSVDDAAAQIKFKLGIGSNFFFEVAKFKAFRALWYTVVQSYKPEHSCSTIAYIEAETGFLNKSLKDPHNNLLRQTTEALSAVLGGVDELTIRPYNAWSTDTDLDKTQRLGLNIALLLKEESYLDKVIDPAGGAYILDDLMNSIKEKSWTTFQKLEKEGIDFLKSAINSIAKKRIEKSEKQENKHIGINKYFNNEPSKTAWKVEIETAFGTPVILEKDCQIEVQL
jgi:methylmalonyl-CoA mutase